MHHTAITHKFPIGRRSLVGMLVAGLALIAGLAQAAPADASIAIRQNSDEPVTFTDPGSFQSNQRERIEVSSVDPNTWRISVVGTTFTFDRVFDVRPQPFCSISAVDGGGNPTQVTCPRRGLGIKINHGGGDDTTLVDPAFPDRVNTNGSSGDDLLQTGAGNDKLIGGSGNNTLNGQLGNDSFFNDNGTGTINALDGQGDSRIQCDDFQRVYTMLAILDLQDDDFAPGCGIIDRRPLNEPRNVRFLTKKAEVSNDGSVEIKLSCPSQVKSRCKGTLKATESGKTKSQGSESYSIKSGKSGTVEVELSDKLVDKIEDKSRTVDFTSTEQGELGKKTTIRGVKLSS